MRTYIVAIKERTAPIFYSQGRLPRWPFFIWTVLLTVVGVILASIVIAIKVVLIALSMSVETATTITWILNLPIAFGFTYFFVCLSMQRFQDCDLSAWWFFLYLIPALNGILLLFQCLWPGTKGPNRFGPDPYNLNAATRVQDIIDNEI